MNKKMDNRMQGGLLFFIFLFAVLVYSFYSGVLLWGIIGGIGILIGILGTGFWVWMLIDCIKNEPSEGNDKLIWVIIIVFTHVLGAAIYYFTKHSMRIEEVVR